MPTRSKMYYISKVEGVARVLPSLFNEKLEDAVLQQLKKDYENMIAREVGKIVCIISVDHIGEGVIIPGDGAAYYKTKFTVLNYLPEVHEIIEGDVMDIAKFGAFVDFGPFSGMVHVSQTMDDYVSVSNDNTLQGKESGRVLKIGDKVRARIVAVSFKQEQSPKIGLTMRQPNLGKLEWLSEKPKEKPKKAKKEAK